VEKGLEYSHPGPAHTAGYLERPLLEELGPVTGRSLLDVGCGNGAVSASLAHRGARVVGIDLSETGVALAKERYPELEWAVMSVYDDLQSGLNRQFDFVVGLEVIEHLFDIRASSCVELSRS
jgi:2-polyprenyl-6-hydroxyphenyl methylase/3-demethylubiquinone-9 3-methyltransferase